MKKLALLAIAACFTIHSFAATYTIMVSDFSFSPTSLTVHPGDIIEWKWVSGTHTTTSTTIPAGATSWDSPISSANPVFDYTVPAALGTYNYKCTPHASMGMTGSFTVSATGVEQIATDNALSIFPNPAATFIHLQLSQPAAEVSVTVIDMNGRIAMQNTFATLKDNILDIKALPQGTYIVYSTQGNVQLRQTFTVLR